MRFKFVLGLLLCSTSLFAQSGFRLRLPNPSEVYAEQRRIVGTWCRQDYEGLRLAPNGWQQFKSITTMKENPDAPGIVVVSRYQIEQRDPQASSWSLDVTYAVIGRYEHSSGYVSDEGTDTVTFRMKDVDGDILITDVDPAYPHMSKKAAVEWMKRQLASPTISDLDKYHLTNALKVLDPTPAATPAKPTP